MYLYKDIVDQVFNTSTVVSVPGIDADVERNREEEMMLRDANMWLSGAEKEEVHCKSGATALHVAAAKGYIKVIK